MIADIGNDATDKQGEARRSRWPRIPLALVVSVVSLVLSGASAYYTMWRPPKFDIQLGDFVQIAKQWDDHLHLFTTVQVVNEGAKGGWLSSVRLQCRISDGGRESPSFVLYSVYNGHINRDGWAVMDQISAPEYIVPNSPKMLGVLFSSEAGLLTSKRLIAGRCSCDISFRKLGSDKFNIGRTVSFSLSRDNATTIDTGICNLAIAVEGSGLERILTRPRECR